MSELEKLKSDLESIRRTSELLVQNEYLHLGCLSSLADKIESKIKELETPPDPHQRAKDFVNKWRENRLPSDFLADYAAHLEDEVERLKNMLANASTIESELLESKSKLESELKSRPVVWCLKNYQD